MSRIRVTPRARDDLLSIGRYTSQRWGKPQRNTYLRAFERRFYWLAENPNVGRHRPDICDGYYCFPQGEHLIFYVIDVDAVTIIGVLHRAMDVASQFVIDVE